MWLFCLLDPGQIRYRPIYTHPNQIPGYATGLYGAFFNYGQQHFIQTLSKLNVLDITNGAVESADWSESP